MHEGKTDSLGTYKGEVSFDLYGEAYPQHWIAEGDEYKVTISFADGSSIEKKYPDKNL
ncbi:MAG: hypothetical protein GTN76_08785 [Candidatus Aenigmarchaeota archaeon]|nr:hypothetical protein [Candidatus Aenigmarchaeota archaeon]